jgi:hypothetical protein
VLEDLESVQVTLNLSEGLQRPRQLSFPARDPKIPLVHPHNPSHHLERSLRHSDTINEKEACEPELELLLVERETAWLLALLGLTGPAFVERRWRGVREVRGFEGSAGWGWWGWWGVELGVEEVERKRMEIGLLLVVRLGDGGVVERMIWFGSFVEGSLRELIGDIVEGAERVRGVV